MRSSISSSCFAAVSLAVLSLAAGCATQPAAESAGTLQIPLTQAGPDGATYHLAGSFQFSGPGGVTQIDEAGDDPAVSVELAPGLYDVSLLDGWQLSKLADDGQTFESTTAILGSPNPNQVRILGNQPASLGFQFLIRNPDGNLTVSFGVTAQPRELAGGMVVETGTGDYAPYAGQRLDYAIYYDLASTTRTASSAGDNTVDYTAGFVGAEFFNDVQTLLSAQVGPAFAGGHLEWSLTAHPDGSQTLTGELDSFNDPFTTLMFGPRTLDTAIPLDADGFPTDAFIFDSFVPFTMTTQFLDSPEDDTLTGQLRFRALPQIGDGF
jgi:hypothetical protein